MIADLYSISRPLHILLVEDSPADALFVRKGLQRLQTPTELHVAADAEHAMTYLGCGGREPPEDVPDMVLLDLNLPGMKGLELLDCIRHDERMKNTCVVILTSSNADQDVQRARELRADDYLLKPNSLKELYALLERVESSWLKKLPRPCNLTPP